MRSLKDHPDQDVEACHATLEGVIEGFVRSGLINDQSYAAARTASMRRAGRSSKYIIQALGHKGIAPADAEAALRGFDEGEGGHLRDAGAPPDLAAAQAFIRKRRARVMAAAPEKTLAALARAGFSYDIARKALESAS